MSQSTITKITRERDELHAKLEFIFQQFRYLNNVRLGEEDCMSVEERTRKIYDCYYGRNGEFLLPHLTRVERGEADRITWHPDWTKEKYKVILIWQCGVQKKEQPEFADYEKAEEYMNGLLAKKERLIGKGFIGVGIKRGEEILECIDLSCC